MAHNIENRNGRNSIAYSGETPWHKLGQKIEKAFDAQTALTAGGLDFTVEKIALQTIDGSLRSFMRPPGSRSNPTGGTRVKEESDPRQCERCGNTIDSMQNCGPLIEGDIDYLFLCSRCYRLLTKPPTPRCYKPNNPHLANL